MLRELGAGLFDAAEDAGDGIGRAPSADESFPPQWEYVTSTARRNVVLCSRQAGKTKATRLRARVALAEGLRTLYVAMVRDNAREQFWRPLLLELAEDGWSLDDANETSLVLRTSNGGVVKAWSADDVRDVAKARGYQWDRVIIDEAQSFPDDVLEPLIDHVLTPTLFKSGGSLDMTGTPPPAIAGYFVRAFNEGKWRRFSWSVFDNPHMPGDNVREQYAARGIGPGHAIWEREVLGRLVPDQDALVYPYDAEANGYDPAALFPVEKDAPRIDRDVWRFVLGLDLGFRDRSAIVVVAWRRNDPERRLYVVDEWEQAQLDVDQLAAAFQAIYQRWGRPLVIGDHGGHAAQSILMTLSARFGASIQPKPSDVIVSTQLLADDFRAGRLMAATSSLVARDAALVVWSEGAGGKLEPNAKGYHSDVLDALRYAHWGARHWAAKAPPPPESIADRRARQELERVRSMKQNRYPWSRSRTA